MIRLTVIIGVIFHLSNPALSQDLTSNACGLDQPEANAAIVQVHVEISDGNSVLAVETAERALSLAPACFGAHLVLTEAYNERLGDVQGLSALPLSRKFRSILAKTLTLRPDNARARALQINYLYHAPGLAGGSRNKAKRLLTELDTLAPVAANTVRLDIARSEGDYSALLTLLQDRPISSTEELETRIDVARALFLETDEYLAACPSSYKVAQI